MNNGALLEYQLARSHQSVRRCAGDLTDAEAATLPDGILAPVVWHIGHLAGADLKFIELAGLTPATTLPDRYGALFRPGTGGAANYPSLGEVVKTFDATHDALKGVVAEATLDTPVEDPPGPFTTLAEMFSFAAAHRWYHVGKITSLRGLLGKPRLFG